MASFGYRERQRGSPVRLWGLRLGFFALLAAGWEWLGRSAGSLLLPTFGETMAALVRLVMSPELWRAMWMSNQAMVLGFGLAAVTGVATGLCMGRWKAADRFLDPYLSISLVTPMSAVIPIVIMAAGLGLAARVLIVFLFTVATVTINTRAGLRMVEPGWMEMSRAFGATERQLWTKVLLRGARPAILTGLRLGLIRAVAGMITMELLLIAVGLGRLILDFQGYFEAANMYAAVIVVIAEALILIKLFQRLEVHAAPWAGQAVVE